MFIYFDFGFCIFALPCLRGMTPHSQHSPMIREDILWRSVLMYFCDNNISLVFNQKSKSLMQLLLIFLSQLLTHINKIGSFYMSLCQLLHAIKACVFKKSCFSNNTLHCLVFFVWLCVSTWVIHYFHKHSIIDSTTRI